MKWIIILLTLVVGILVGATILRRFAPASRPAIRHESTGPTLERVREMAQLVTLRLPVSDVRVSELSGRLGGISLILLAHGDVEIAVDLRQARIASVDEADRRAVISLPSPSFHRPRLNHDRTRLYRFDRAGVWLLTPGQAGEAELVNAALQDAQRCLVDTLDRPELLADARQLTHQILSQLLAPRGWEIVLHWEE